ncbi:hypothetical protein [Aliamphritea spongicola]|nr:hypothetical protein [Aliamphritea spongicola]
MYKWTFLKSVLVSFALLVSAFSYADNHQLDINTASAVQLASQLNGVGAKKAAAIVTTVRSLVVLPILSSLKMLRDW